VARGREQPSRGDGERRPASRGLAPERRRLLVALLFFLVCLAVFLFFALGGLFH
jgi:hypothetical protein